MCQCCGHIEHAATARSVRNEPERTGPVELECVSGETVDRNVSIDCTSTNLRLP